MGMKIFDQFVLLLCFFMASALVSQDIESVNFSQFLSLRIKLVCIRAGLSPWALDSRVHQERAKKPRSSSARSG
jgi:hypothetical protein